MQVYVSIGNSDGKLSAGEWAAYWTATHALVRRRASRIYGVWHSLPATPYVNACWSFEVPVEAEAGLQEELRMLCREFRQDSVAWGAAETTFLTPG